jgi:hypothetical protein
MRSPILNSKTHLLRTRQIDIGHFFPQFIDIVYVGQESAGQRCTCRRACIAVFDLLETLWRTRRHNQNCLEGIDASDIRIFLQKGRRVQFQCIARIHQRKGQCLALGAGRTNRFRCRLGPRQSIGSGSRIGWRGIYARRFNDGSIHRRASRFTRCVGNNGSSKRNKCPQHESKESDKDNGNHNQSDLRALRICNVQRDKGWIHLLWTSFPTGVWDGVLTAQSGRFEIMTTSASKLCLQVPSLMKNKKYSFVKYLARHYAEIAVFSCSARHGRPSCGDRIVHSRRS